MVSKLEIIVFDVGHGACVLVRTPNDRTILIDPGHTDDFSPAEHLRKVWKTKQIDMLVVTHPHGDHINDMVAVDSLLKVESLLRNKTMPDKMICPGGDKAPEADKTYLVKYHKKYTHARPRETSMCNPDYNGGVRVVTASLDYDPRTPLSPNNLSQAIRLSYGQLDILFPGDIEPAGVAELSKSKPSLFTVDDPNAAYRVLLAPHHGRDSGTSTDLLDAFQPDLTIICDEYGSLTTNVDFYRNHCNGMSVYCKSKDVNEARKILTTKTNDYVYLSADLESCLVQIP